MACDGLVSACASAPGDGLSATSSDDAVGKPAAARRECNTPARSAIIAKVCRAGQVARHESARASGRKPWTTRVAAAEALEERMRRAPRTEGRACTQ